MKKSRFLLLLVAIATIAGTIFYLEQPRQHQMESGEMITLGPVESSSEFKVGEAAPNFLLTDYEGNLHQLSDYKGKAVLLNFWASWCPFCIEELPLFQQYYELHQNKDFEIIAINREENLERAKSYTDPMNLDYTILLNQSDDVQKAYKLRAMPSSYFIDKNGILQEIVLGPLTEATLSEKLDTLLEIPQENEEVEELSTETQVSASGREIQITDGVKHSVPLDDILGGGPPKDGIPSIDTPQFVSVKEANKILDDEGLGIGFTHNGVERFYPFQILVWHEIVNDIVGGQPALISYCPLCGTGIAFNPMVNGKITQFGTSGKLWNSNLVMYDRQTDSYWSQVLGEAIVGEKTGTRLELLPHQNISWKHWKEAHPKGEVLSTDTGYFRNYKTSPYGDYASNTSLYFPVDYEDDRYHKKAFSWGLVDEEAAKVYVKDELELMASRFEDEFNGETIIVEFNKKNLNIKFTYKDSGEEIIPFFGFWFSWIAAHPASEVFSAS